jgi:heme exporter protein A
LNYYTLNDKIGSNTDRWTPGWGLTYCNFEQVSREKSSSMNGPSLKDRYMQSHLPDCFIASAGATISYPETRFMLSATQLAFRRGDAWLFTDVSFEIHPAQILWLRGKNGRGKTSLLRLVVGLTQPDHGTLTWDGVPLHDAPDYRSQLVYIGHTNGLKDDLTVSESLHFLARLHDRDSTPDSVSAALLRLAIHHRSHLPVRTLSQGQRRRVALARLALEQGPSLWVLDEPFDTLDQEGISIINGLLEEHLARHGSVILTSHLPFSLKGIHQINVLDLDEGSA